MKIYKTVKEKAEIPQTPQDFDTYSRDSGHMIEVNMEYEIAFCDGKSGQLPW